MVISDVLRVARSGHAIEAATAKLGVLQSWSGSRGPTVQVVGSFALQRARGGLIPVPRGYNITLLHMAATHARMHACLY